MSEFVVYGAKGPKCSCSGYDEFVRMVDKLSSADVSFDYIEISSASEIPEGSEARELFDIEGKGSLPISVYMGAVVKSHSYPNEQDIVDYIDVPSGVLDARRTTVAMANDLPPACSCRKH